MVVVGDFNTRRLVWRLAPDGHLVGLYDHSIGTNTQGAGRHAEQLRQMAIEYELRQFNSVKRWPDFTQLELFFVMGEGNWQLTENILELTSVDCAHVLFNMATL